MLAGLPLLKDLVCNGNHSLTGNISSLRVLKETLEKLKIHDCGNEEGDFMDLADFPRLRELNFCRTNNVTGNIRDIRGRNFPALESLYLPKSVHGGIDYEFQHISDVPEFMQAIHLLLKRTPTLFDKNRLNWALSLDSPDWYDWEMILELDEWEFEDESPEAPFYLQLFKRDHVLDGVGVLNLMVIIRARAIG